MDIVGRGFLARHLFEAFSGRFPEVSAFAAGVSSTSVTAAEEFDREAALLYKLLRRCREQRRMLLFFSTASFAMYGSQQEPAAEDGPLFPPTTYGRHKLALESSIRSAGVPHLILRVSHLVGRHQRAHQLLPAMTRQVQSGSVSVYESAYRDLLDVRDLVYVIGRLLEDGAACDTVNVVSGTPVPVVRLVDGIEERLGLSPRRVLVPAQGSVMRTLVSTEQLEKLVPGFGAERVGTGYLKRMLDAYLPYYASLPAS
jgi:NDP-hexose 4-ketoreductase